MCVICMWHFLSVTVENFLLHSGFRQVKTRSRVMSSLGLTVPKLVFVHVNDELLIHSSAASAIPNISSASVRSMCIQFLSWTGRPLPAVWRSDWHSFSVNLKFIQVDAKRFMHLDRTFVVIRVVGVAVFNSWSDFYLRDQQPRALRLKLLRTADGFRSSITRSTIVASPYSSVGLANASMQAALRRLRTWELFSKVLIHMICCLARWAFARTTVEGSPFAPSTSQDMWLVVPMQYVHLLQLVFRVLRLLPRAYSQSLLEHS